jgi:hypothetical protein
MCPNNGTDEQRDAAPGKGRPRRGTTTPMRIPEHGDCTMPIDRVGHLPNNTSHTQQCPSMKSTPAVLPTVGTTVAPSSISLPRFNGGGGNLGGPWSWGSQRSHQAMPFYPRVQEDPSPRLPCRHTRGGCNGPQG